MGLPTTEEWESADWMRQRAFSKSADNGTDIKRCYVHLGNEGSSQHDHNRRIRSCYEYQAIRKNADWGNNGTFSEMTAYFHGMEEYYDRNGLRYCIFDLPDINDPYTFGGPMIYMDMNGTDPTGTGTGGHTGDEDPYSSAWDLMSDFSFDSWDHSYNRYDCGGPWAYCGQLDGRRVLGRIQYARIEG